MLSEPSVDQPNHEFSKPEEALFAKPEEATFEFGLLDDPKKEVGNLEIRKKEYGKLDELSHRKGRDSKYV